MGIHDRQFGDDNTNPDGRRGQRLRLQRDRQLRRRDATGEQDDGGSEKCGNACVHRKSLIFNNSGRQTSRGQHCKHDYCKKVRFLEMQLQVLQIVQFRKLEGVRGDFGRQLVQTSFTPSSRWYSLRTAAPLNSACPPFRFRPITDNSTPLRRRQPKRASSAT
jgi:hypothetical protein